MPSAESWLWCFRAGVGLILLGSLLFMLGFCTDHWVDTGSVNYGLWERCVGARCSTHEADDLEAYHIATQAMQIVALFFYAVGPILHFCLYVSKKNKGTGWRSRVFDGMYSVGTVFHLASVVVYGLEHPDSVELSWSYRMSAAAVPIAVTGIFLAIISRSKALVKFRFRPSSKNSGRKGKVGALVDSRSSTPQSYNGRRTSRSIMQQKHSSNHANATSPLDVKSGTPPGVNVNINIISHPPSDAQSSKMPYPAPYGNQAQSADQVFAPYGNQAESVDQGAYYSASASPTAPGAPSHIIASQQPYPNTFDAQGQDPYVTNVKPAPVSSRLSDTDSPQRRTFGPSEKQRRILNTSDSHALGPIRGFPSAPLSESPENEFVVPDSHPPPPYADVVRKQGEDGPSSAGPNKTSTV